MAAVFDCVKKCIGFLMYLIINDAHGIEKLLLKTQKSNKFLHSEVNLLIQHIIVQDLDKQQLYLLYLPQKNGQQDLRTLRTEPDIIELVPVWLKNSVSWFTNASFRFRESVLHIRTTPLPKDIQIHLNAPNLFTFPVEIKMVSQLSHLSIVQRASRDRVLFARDVTLYR